MFEGRKRLENLGKGQKYTKVSTDRHTDMELRESPKGRERGGAGGDAAGAGREGRPRLGEGGQSTRKRLLPRATVAEENPTLGRANLWVSSPPRGNRDSCSRFIEH